MAELLNMKILDALHEMEEPGSNAFLTEIVTTYVSDGEARFKALHNALAAGDPVDIARISHALKGGSLNVGADGLASLMQAIENKAKAGSLCGVDELSDAEELFMRVTKALASYRG